MDEPVKLNIKHWAAEDRPREKMLLKGRQALSDAELLAILIGSGNAKMSAVDLSRLILNTFNNDLNALSMATINELTAFNGMGTAKAVTISAALELARRRKEQAPALKPNLYTAELVYKHMHPYLADLPHEEFWVIYLNNKLQEIKTVKLGMGGINFSAVDIRTILKQAIDYYAVNIIAVHNHPSGNCLPSNEDKKITQKLKKAGELLDIKLRDHIIYTQNEYFSFTEMGML